MDGARALYFALAPTLLIYGTMNWDLLAVALATVGLLVFFRRRDGGRGALLGLGAAAKFYPGMLARPLDRAASARPASPTGRSGWRGRPPARWLVVNLPFAIAAPSAWLTFFRFNSERAADFDSLWYIACRHLEFCPTTRTVNLLSLASFLRVVRARVGREGAQRPDVPAVDAGLPDAGPVPGHEQGVLTAVRTVALALVRAGPAADSGLASRSRSPTCWCS